MSETGITVGGKTFTGWTSVSVTRSMEQLAHSFELEFVEAWTEQSQAIPILEGDACEVSLSDEQSVVNGYVSESNFDQDATSHRMTVTGGSKTIDLVECSAIYALGKGQWRNKSLSLIAADLCQPFGITVSVKTDIGSAFRRFSINDGESVFETLERAARLRGVLLTTSGAGELVITRAGTKKVRTALQRGVNIIAGSRRGSHQNRFSQYIVKGQVSGDSDIFGDTTVTPKSTSLDSAVSRYRPLIIAAEGQEFGTALQKRADWERNVRAGRSQRLTYTVDGWEHDDGLWEPNTLVKVIDPTFRVSAELLLISVVNNKNENGTNSILELVDPKTMSIEPLTVKSKAKDSWP